MKKFIALAICLMCLLTGCKQTDTPKNQSDNVNTSSPINNDDSTYIKIGSNVSAEYKAAITAYNKFLNGEITAKGNDGTSFNVLQYGTGNGISNFALGDVNNDNVPELFIHESHYAVLGFDGNNLTEWYDSMSWQSISLLENGAILDTFSNVGVHYNYVTFKEDGIDKLVSFGKPLEDEVNQLYYFEENGLYEEISKREWETRTKPYFEQTKKTVELNWIKWEKKNNQIVSNDKPTVSIPETLVFDFSAKAKAQNPLTKQEVRVIFEPLIKEAVEIQETIINDCGDFELLKDPVIVVNNEPYYPVKDDQLKTLNDVWDYVYTSYTKEAAERIFTDRLDPNGTVPRFLEKDGILYYKPGGHGHYMEYYFDTLEIIEQYEDTVVISVDYITFGDEEPQKSVFVISNSEATWKMCNSENEAIHDLPKQFLKQ